MIQSSTPTESNEHEETKKTKKKQIEEKKKIEGIVATHDKLVVIYKMITTNECNLV